jgi:hypothetical protein
MVMQEQPQTATPDAGAEIALQVGDLLPEYQELPADGTPSPDQGQPAEPAAPEASTPEPAPAALEATAPPPAQETAAEAERRLQAEADRVIAKVQRGEDLTPTERAKLRQLGQLAAQLEPDLVQPQVEQARQQAAQEVQQWQRIGQYHEYVTAQQEALRNGQIDYTEAEQNLRNVGFGSFDQAVTWKQTAEMAYAQEQARSNQPDLTPVRQEAFREGVNQLGSAFEMEARKLPELAAISEQDWNTKLAAARQQYGVGGVFQLMRDEIRAAVEKDAARITAQAGQAAQQQARTDLLAQFPAPDIEQGVAGAGDGWRTKAEARNLHAQGRLSNAEMRAILRNPSIPDGY